MEKAGGLSEMRYLVIKNGKFKCPKCEAVLDGFDEWTKHKEQCDLKSHLRGSEQK
jgi:hypothetical protein